MAHLLYGTLFCRQLDTLIYHAELIVLLESVSEWWGTPQYSPRPCVLDCWQVLAPTSQIDRVNFHASGHIHLADYVAVNFYASSHIHSADYDVGQVSCLQSFSCSRPSCLRSFEWLSIIIPLVVWAAVMLHASGRICSSQLSCLRSLNSQVHTYDQIHSSFMPPVIWAAVDSHASGLIPLADYV
jgi:hypothetical protein